MVRQDSEAARRYIEKELKTHVSDPFIGLIVERGDKHIGAVLLFDFRPETNIEITVASSGPWSVSDVRNIIRYCFGCAQRITARVSVNNARAIFSMEALGFQREGLLREFFKDGDAVIYGLLRREQKIVRL